ncbi:MAG: hypothetical protein EXR29_12985 [Betaproteobacteria bacterium]|nr:hypothetical protein [Betaproteobacteria bacterium]
MEVTSLVLVVLGADAADLLSLDVQQPLLVLQVDFVVADVLFQLGGQRLLDIELLLAIKLLLARVGDSDALFGFLDTRFVFLECPRAGLVDVLLAGIGV